MKKIILILLTIFFGSITYAKQENCYKTKDVKVYILMYHYIRPANREPKWSSIYRNSINPEDFEQEVKIIKKLQSNNQINISFMSDLHKFQTNWCFPNKKIVTLTFDDWWVDNYDFIYPILKKYNIKVNLSIIAWKIWSDTKRIDQFMIKSEIQKMIDTWLVEIMSHSYNHLELSKIPKKNLEKEICESKKYLEKALGVKVWTMVYPSGKYDSDVISETKKCWYYYGLTTDTWINPWIWLNEFPFELNRIRLDRSSHKIWFLWN